MNPGETNSDWHRITVKSDGAARLLSLSESTIKRLVEDGEIPSFQVRSCRLFSVELLRQWALSQANEDDLPISELAQRVVVSAGGAARLLSLQRFEVEKLAASGELHSIEVESGLRFSVKDLISWVSSAE